MRLAVFLVFLLLWEVSARLGFIDSFIFGSPSQVCLAFRTLLLTNHLLSHIGITVFETLASFFLVVGFSLFFSVLLWLCPRLAAILEPYLLSVMKINIGLCLVGVVIGEFIGARQGLGFLIIYSSQIFKLDWMILSIILLCIIAMILYQAVSLVEKRVVHTCGADRS